MAARLISAKKVKVMSSNQKVETTKKVEHTPGPYRIILHAGSDGVSVEAGKGQPVANFVGAGTANLANANLFIAGGGMLAALKTADQVICSALDSAGFAELYPNKQEREAAHAEHITIKLIRAAIKKAGGQ
jgi:hypothetical protein